MDVTTILREGFSYKDGQIYVEVDGKYYSRESAESLYRILTDAPPPEMKTKSGEVSKRQPKDTHNAQFYTAQMIHYGLKPLKTREPAKKKLLASYSNDDARVLQIPANITLLEESMAKEWHGEMKKQSQENKGESSKTVDSTPVEQKPVAVPAVKRPRTKQTARKTTGGATPTSGRSSAHSVAKPQPLVIPEASRTVPAVKCFRTKQTARKTTGGVPPTSAGSSTNLVAKPQPMSYTGEYEDDILDSTARNPVPRTKQTAVKVREALNAVAVRREELKKKVEAKQAAEVQKPKDELKSGIESLSAKDARRILQCLLDKVPSVEKILARELVSLTRSKGKSNESNMLTWTGRYEIHAPALDNWDESERIVPTIEIYPSSTSAHLWASFEFGIISGVMRSIYPVPSGGGLNAEIPFEWRGREAGENQMSIDNSNRALFTFLEDGTLEGRMEGSFLETFKLYGLSMPTDFRGNPTPQKSQAHQIKEVRSWKNEWRGLNYHNYEVENKARWGGWGGEGQDESAFESDTTDGHHKRESKINIEKFVKELNKELDDEDDYGFGYSGPWC